MCCRTSAAPSTRSGARTRCMASAGRSRSPMSASRIRCARRSSTPRSRRAIRATTISTGRRRRAPAISSSRRRTAGAGRRRSAICSEARRRSNLVVETNALASRILFEGRRAVGVEYRQGGTTRVARASGEVILAGGAFNSPQLMQLSGLGPAELLRAHGIDVTADMPGVGDDLQDHLQVRIQYRCTEPITMNDVVNSWRQRIGAGMRYASFRKGLLAIGAGYAGGFFRTERKRGDARCAGALHHLQRRSVGGGAASVSGLHRVDLSVAAGEPRLRAHQVGRSGRSRRRSSRDICQTRSTAIRWWPV